MATCLSDAAMVRSSYPPSTTHRHLPSLTPSDRGRHSFPANQHFLLLSLFISPLFGISFSNSCTFIAACPEHFPVLPLAHLIAHCLYRCLYLPTHTHSSEHLIDLVETVICIPGSELSDHPRHTSVTLTTIPLFNICTSTSIFLIAIKHHSVIRLCRHIP